MHALRQGSSALFSDGGAALWRSCLPAAALAAATAVAFNASSADDSVRLDDTVRQSDSQFSGGGAPVDELPAHHQTLNGWQSVGREVSLPLWVRACVGSVLVSTAYCEASSQHRQSPPISQLPPELPRALLRPFPMTVEEKAAGLGGDIARLHRWLKATGASLAGMTISPVAGAVCIILCPVFRRWFWQVLRTTPQ